MVFLRILPAIIVACLWPALRLSAAPTATVVVSASGDGSVSPAGGTYEIGTRLTFQANPGAGSIFDAWTTTAGERLFPTADRPELEYMVVGDAEIVARFVPTPFTAISRTWAVWLRTIDFDPTGQPLSTGRGSVSVTLNRSGNFTGQLHFDRETFALLGSVNAAGEAALSLPRTGRQLLRVALRFQVEAPQDRLRVAVYDGEVCAMSSVSTIDGTDLANSYTLSLGIAGEEARRGYATFTRTLNGEYRGIGVLENGRPFSFGTRPGIDHAVGGRTWAVDAPLGAGEFLSGTIILPEPLPPGANTFPTRWQWITPPPLPPAPAPTAPPPGATAFVSPTGSDANSGEIDSPLATLDAALALIGGTGEIVMLPGEYEGASLNLLPAGKVTLQAAPGHRASVYFGERIPGTAFTHHSGNVWKASVQSIVPLQEIENRYWIFEVGTAEGSIAPASARPQQRGRNVRLDHFRLHQAASIADVDASDGSYFIENGQLYLRTSDGEPPRADQEFRIPSQSPTATLVRAANTPCEITVRGVEVYFGTLGVDVSGAGRYELSECKFFGSGSSGVLTSSNPIGIEERCDYAANGNDGSSPGNYSIPLSRITIIDPWAHDNGDEGHSLHVRCRGFYFSGLYEENVKGGITPAIGAEATILGAFTRGNEGGISPAVEPPVHVFVADWTSQHDFDGLENWTTGQVTVVDSRVFSPTNYCFNAIVGGARISVFATQLVGGLGPLGGGGSLTSTFFSGPLDLQRNTSPQAKAINGTIARFLPPAAGQRLAPFANRTPNGHLIVRTAGASTIELAESFTIGVDHVVAIQGANPRQLTLEVDPLTGAFSGEFNDAAQPDVRRAFTGVIFQGPHFGLGSGDGCEITLSIPRESLAANGPAPTFTMNEPLVAAASRFGAAVGMSGSRVVVGAGPTGGAAGGNGMALFYDLASATPSIAVATIADPAPLPGRRFGAAIAVSGTRALIGAPAEGATPAAAFIYDLSTTPPTLLGTLTDPAAPGNRSFGSAVAISGIWMLVGAPADDPGGNSGGRAYLYAMLGPNPTLMATLHNPSPAAGDRFGAAVAVAGTRAIVGAPQDDTTAKDSGRAYLYNVVGPSPGQPVLTFNNPTPAEFDRFGGAVAIFGTRVAIGAAGDDTAALDAGAAYVFDVAGNGPTVPWLTVTKPEASALDGFGRAVAISSLRLVVGADGHDSAVPDAGSAYVYELFGAVSNSTVKALSATAPNAFDCFGCAVAADGPNILVGRAGDPGASAALGGVQVYTLGRSVTVPVGAREVSDGGLFDSITIESGGTLTLQSPPRETMPVGVPSVRLTGTGSGRRLVIEFVRSKSANISYAVEFGDLPDNESLQPAINAPIVTPIDADLEHVFVEDTISVGDQPSRFGRVRITTP